MEEEKNMWLTAAREAGFEQAVLADPALLTPDPRVREACAADRCGAYGKNWTCPPAVGTLGECAERLRSFGACLLVQTVYPLEKKIDTKGYRAAEELHRKRLGELGAKLRGDFPGALVLGAGGCRVCPVCACPEPCRAPEKAQSSMEAYGLFVTKVCRDAGLAYYYGPKTIAYTGCILFGKKEE